MGLATGCRIPRVRIVLAVGVPLNSAMERITRHGILDRQLAVARVAVLANMADPGKAVEPFDPILDE